MRLTISPVKGWLQSRPFFLLLLLSSCATAPAPPPCGLAGIRTEPRLAFAPVDSGLPRSGQWRDGFDLADMNGDGDLDVVHGPPRKGRATPAIFLGDGAGHFIPWRTARFPPLPLDYGDAKAADFDGNGTMDLALASHLRGLTVLVQESEGHFAPWASGLELRLPAGGIDPPFTSRAIAVADWNRDGLPDLLALNEGPTQFGPRPPAEALALYLNRRGEWQRISAPAPRDLYGTSIAAGDVNGDGYPDAILGSSVAGARSLLQLGDGRSWTSRELATLAAGAYVTAVAVHDGAILTASAWQSRCVAIDAGSTPLLREESNDPFVAIVPADLDGDTRPDLLALRRHGSMTAFRGTASGYVRDADVAAPASMAGCDAYDAQAADLDRDGAAEVIVSFAGDVMPTLGEQCTHGGGFVVWRVNFRP